ncbi:MAG: hypothetical protein V7720_18465 [Halioglobus sp.]
MQEKTRKRLTVALIWLVGGVCVSGVYLINFYSADFLETDPLPYMVALISYEDAVAIRIGWAEIMAANTALFLSLFAGMLIIYSTKAKDLKFPAIFTLAFLYIIAAGYAHKQWTAAYEEASIAQYQADTATVSEDYAEKRFEGRRWMGGRYTGGFLAGVYLPAFLFVFGWYRESHRRVYADHERAQHLARESMLLLAKRSEDPNIPFTIDEELSFAIEFIEEIYKVNNNLGLQFFQKIDEDQKSPFINSVIRMLDSSQLPARLLAWYWLSKYLTDETEKKEMQRAFWGLLNDHASKGGQVADVLLNDPDNPYGEHVGRW